MRNYVGGKSSPKVVFFDLDGTLIKGLSQYYLVRYLFGKKKINFSFLLIISVWSLLYRYGILKNPESILKFGCRITKGWKTVDQKEFMDRFFNQELVQKFYPELLVILNDHREMHHITVLITNAIKPVAEVVGCYLGFDFIIATELEAVDGTYNGLISGDVVFGAVKAKKGKQFMQNQGFSFDIFSAYSDHVSDLPLLEMVQNPVAVNPDPKLRKIACKRNWRIIDCNAESTIA